MRKKIVIIACLLFAIPMLVLPVSTVSAQPILQISNVAKQIGSISARIQNVGTADATNVQWSFTFVGGIIFRPTGGQMTGTLASLPAATDANIKTPVCGLAGVLGIPQVTITISASCSQVPSVSVNALWHHILFPLIW